MLQNSDKKRVNNQTSSNAFFSYISYKNTKLTGFYKDTPLSEKMSEVFLGKRNSYSPFALLC